MTDATIEGYNKSISDCKDVISEQNEQMVEYQAGLIVYIKHQLKCKNENNDSLRREIKVYREELISATKKEA